MAEFVKKDLTEQEQAVVSGLAERWLNNKEQIDALNAAQKELAAKYIAIVSPLQIGDILKKKSGLKMRLPNTIIIVSVSADMSYAARNRDPYLNYSYRVLKENGDLGENRCSFFRQESYELIPKDDPIYQKVSDPKNAS